MSYTKEEIYSPQTTEQIAAHVKEILRLLGEDTSREGLLKTPERVAKALQFTTKGYSEDGIEIIRQAIFDEKYQQMVLVRDIELYKTHRPDQRLHTGSPASAGRSRSNRS